MDGVPLCARFSIATNRLQYCGPDGADSLLYRAITERGDTAEAREALRRFEALAPYLELIGENHGLDPFDLRVVEAYWIGNELLDSFDRSDFARLLDRLVHRGLPRSLARRLTEHLPTHPIPHHAFHVGFVGVGNVTGHVATTLANIEACRPSWGEVRGLGDRSLTLSAPSLAWEAGRMRLGPARTVVLPYDAKVIPRVTRGDTVAFHWSTPALRLDPDEGAQLRRYTELSLAAASEAFPGPGGTLRVPGGT